MAVAPPQSRVPFEQVAAPTAVAAPASPWPTRIAWGLAALVILAIGLVWLTPGFPQRKIIDVTKWFDDFRGWAIQNRTTSPLFTYVLTPIEDAVSFVIDKTVLVL